MPCPCKVQHSIGIVAGAHKSEITPTFTSCPSSLKEKFSRGTKSEFEHCLLHLGSRPENQNFKHMQLNTQLCHEAGTAHAVLSPHKCIEMHATMHVHKSTLHEVLKAAATRLLSNGLCDAKANTRTLADELCKALAPAWPPQSQARLRAE